jgi:hypothetical protein
MLPTIVIMKTKKSKDKEKDVGSHSCMGENKFGMKRFHAEWRSNKQFCPSSYPFVFFCVMFTFPSHESSKHELPVSYLLNFVDNFNIKFHFSNQSCKEYVL